jgi:hypothetical protein
MSIRDPRPNGQRMNSHDHRCQTPVIHDHDLYGQIEEQFQDAMDEGLNPARPEVLDYGSISASMSAANGPNTPRSRPALLAATCCMRHGCSATRPGTYASSARATMHRFGRLLLAHLPDDRETQRPHLRTNGTTGNVTEWLPGWVASAWFLSSAARPARG